MNEKLPRIIKITEKAKQPPGTLSYVKDNLDEVTGTENRTGKITVIDYSESNFSKFVYDEKNLENLSKYNNPSSVTWIKFENVLNPEPIKFVGETFGIHKLTLEDILNQEQRPKTEVFEDEGYLFLIIHYLRYNEVTEDVRKEQISIISSPNFVITFCEFDAGVF